MLELCLSLIFLVSPAFAQTTPNPEFRETAVIPAFRRVNPRMLHFQTFHKQALDGPYTLLLVRGGAPTPGWSSPITTFWWNRDDLLGLFLMETANPNRVWTLAILASEGVDCVVKVDRADKDSIVLSRSQADYGLPMESIKLFFDVTSKELLKRISYAPVAVPRILPMEERLYFVASLKERLLAARQEEGGPLAVSGAEADRVLARLPDLVRRSKEPPLIWLHMPFPAPRPATEPDYIPLGLGTDFYVSVIPHTSPESVEGVVERSGRSYKPHPLPPSSYADFRRARPRRVQDGYTAESTHIGESIGPYQIAGDRFWFGKVFYDGEGETGVGGIGYFDPAQRKFVVFSPPDLVDWSTSALLVEQDTVWIGLVRHPEGAPSPGGLVRFDPATGRTQKQRLEEIIFAILRWKDALYLGASNGLYVLHDGRRTRYVFEPTVTGEFRVFQDGL